MFVIEQPKRVSCPTKLAAVVLDWAGTTVDYGSRAPVAAMQAAFEHAGVPITEIEARRPMGTAKRDHLQAILADPKVAERWRSVHKTDSDERDLDRIYHEFLTLQAETVAEYSLVIDGCIEAVAYCRDQEIKIGSTTGYTRKLLDKVEQRATEEGYSPDSALSADDVAPGRPAPWLCIESARRLGVYPMSAVLKVDDTPAGVRAGRNAGAWSVGVVDSGNEVGLTKQALEALSVDERQLRLDAASTSLQNAGAHLLIRTIAELPLAIDHVNSLLESGELP